MTSSTKVLDTLAAIRDLQAAENKVREIQRELNAKRYKLTQRLKTHAVTDHEAITHYIINLENRTLNDEELRHCYS